MPETKTAPPADQPEPGSQPPDRQPTEDDLVRGEGNSTEQERTEMAIARANSQALDRGDWSLPVRHAIDRAQMDLLRATVAKDCNGAELAMLMEISARYGLDPFLKEIYAAKFDGRDGGVTVFTGRDGFLKAARKTQRFVRMVSNVVRAKDEFEVELSLDPGESPEAARITRLHHKRVGMGSESRGAIVGAYALVWRAGDPEPWYAEASWDDHGAQRQKDNSNRDTTWTVNSKKGFPEDMMRKVPESRALRAAFGITGIAGAEELGDRPEVVQNLSDAGGATGTTAQPLVVDYRDDDLGRELRELVAGANELLPGSWRAAKVAMRINGKDTAARLKLRDTLRRFIGQRNDGREMLDKIVKADDPTITDATVVEDGKAPEAPEGSEGSQTTGEGDAGPEEPQGEAEGEPEAEVVDGEPVPDEWAHLDSRMTPEFDAHRQSALIDAVVELRATIQGMGEDADTTLEGAEATDELRVAVDELELMNRAAEAAGHERIEV